MLSKVYGEDEDEGDDDSNDGEVDDEDGDDDSVPYFQDHQASDDISFNGITSAFLSILKKGKIC